MPESLGVSGKVGRALVLLFFAGVSRSTPGRPETRRRVGPAPETPRALRHAPLGTARGSRSATSLPGRPRLLEPRPSPETRRALREPRAGPAAKKISWRLGSTPRLSETPGRPETRRALRQPRGVPRVVERLPETPPGSRDSQRTPDLARDLSETPAAARPRDPAPHPGNRSLRDL